MSLLNILELAWYTIEQYADKYQDTMQNKIIVPDDGSMRMSKQGLCELGMYEALANSVYLDSVGIRTVSLGLTKTDIKDIESWPWDKTLTDQQAISLYAQKVQHYVYAVNHELKVPLKQYEFDVLVSITYNIGTGDLVHDRGGMAGSTFIDLVNAKADPQDIVYAMAAWNRGTINGRRVVIKGLVNRRNAEGQLYLTGKYKNDGTVSKIRVDPITHKPIYSGRVNIEQYL